MTAVSRFFDSHAAVVLMRCNSVGVSLPRWR